MDKSDVFHDGDVHLKCIKKVLRSAFPSFPQTHESCNQRLETLEGLLLSILKLAEVQRSLLDCRDAALIEKIRKLALQVGNRQQNQGGI